jgi:hypothetical protein
MAYTKYSLTPADNNAAPPNGAPEGMLPSAVNDTMRDMMAQIRDVGDGIRGGTYTMTAPIITGGSINGAAIGASSASTGAFSTLSATGVTTVQAGTVSAPAITTTGDTNTGIFFPAADTIAFTEGGVEAMRINSSGNLGIGTSSPQAKLHVSNSSSGLLFSEDGSKAVIIGTNAAGTVSQELFLRGDPLTFTGSGGGGAEHMRLNSDGNVGIGTSSPSTKLHVAGGDLRLNDNFAIGWGGTGAAIIGANNSLLRFDVNGSERMRIDSSGNVGIGITPSAWSVFKALQVGTGTLASTTNTHNTSLAANAYFDGSDWKYIASTDATEYRQNGGEHYWSTAVSGTAGNNISWSERMRIDASGDVGIGNSSPANKLDVIGSLGADACQIKTTNSATATNIKLWNAVSSGDNIFASFATETSFTARGSITYNRAGGLVAYNVSSDYRAKDIIGSVLNSGEVIDSVPVYMGKMKGATQARPMFIAHETPDYAHTGEKDAVDKDGNPIYQQMDVSSLVPVLWAEIQSLRKRVAQLESK